MKIDCKEFHEVMTNCGRLKNNKYLPILQYAMVELSPQTATITATNLDITYIAKIKGDGDDNSRFLIPIAGATKILAGKKGPFDLTGINTTVNLTFPNGLSASISSLDIDDYPETEVMSGMEPVIYDASSFQEILTRVIYAASLDDSRFNLNAICFDEDKVIATDGHRMEMAELSVKLTDKPIIVPSKAVAFVLASKMLNKGNVSIFLYEKVMVLEKDGKRVIMKLIEGDYPDYKRVIPSGSVSKLIMVDRKKLLSAVLELKPFLEERNHGINVLINGRIDMSKKHPDMGTAKMSVPCETTNNEDVSLILNLHYMVDALKVSNDDRITMTYVKEGAPIIFSGDSQWSLLMPMKK